MSTTEHTEDRWFVTVIRSICEAQGITLTAYSDNWLLELSRGSQLHRILGSNFGLNSSVAAGCAEDKVAAYTILSANNIPALPHALARTKATPYTTWQNNDWDEVVVKPIAGKGGYGVRKFNNKTEAATWINQQPSDGWTVSPYKNIRREVRLIILNGTLLLSYEKQPVAVDDLLMFNLGLGATPTNVTPSESMTNTAIAACRILDLRLAAVDIIELEDGSSMILEVNDDITMEHYARTSKAYEDDAYRVYESIITTLFDNGF